MKVLIVTYYWPPAGGSGVQRWLKFVKYLQNFGIEPIVYTVDNPLYAIFDKGLENEIPNDVEILRQPIWEPNNLLGKNKQKSAGFLDSKPNFFGKIMQYIRANYFIPDARKFWIKPSVKYLTAYLKKNKVDVVITTGPPHSMHLIGLKLKKKSDVKWISDFRDPWTEIDYFHQLPLTKKSLAKHHKLEQEVLKKSNAVIVVGKTMKEKYQELTKNIHIITNGYDFEKEFKTIKLDKKFTITHVGMMNDDRNPTSLWKVLSKICKENKEFKNDLEIKLIGKIAESCIDAIKNNELNSNLNLIQYLTHENVITHQKSSQVLLLVINNVPSAKGIITGKIFEYLISNRPILAIGPTEGDASEIILNSKTGSIVDFEDEVQLKRTILEYYENYKKGDLNVNANNIEQYHRKELTEKLSKIIKNI